MFHVTYQSNNVAVPRTTNCYRSFRIPFQVARDQGVQRMNRRNYMSEGARKKAKKKRADRWEKRNRDDRAGGTCATHVLCTLTLKSRSCRVLFFPPTSLDGPTDAFLLFEAFSTFLRAPPSPDAFHSAALAQHLFLKISLLKI